MFKAKLNTDGGSRGNPGPAGLGFVLTDLAGRPISEGGWFLGKATNNVAEYSALIWGLQNALAAQVDYLTVYADSELIVKQLNGVYQVKSEDLKPLFFQAKSLLARFKKATIEHVYRTDNKEADHLANDAMDGEESLGSYLLPWNGTLTSLFDSLGLENKSTLQDAKSATLGKPAAEGRPIRVSDIACAKASIDTQQGSSTKSAFTERKAMEKNTLYTGSRKLSGESYEHVGGHYEMTLKDHFDAAHTLPGYDGSCRYLHGHTWDVEVSIAGEHLDEVGILYDFKDLKRDLHEVLENFDHRYINDAPPFDVIAPTAENLARVIFYELEKTFPSGVFLQEVAVWESPVAKVVYRP